jgi:hypothetical protein
MVSAVREFFLSRKSIAAFGICAVFAAGVTWGMYRYTYHLNLERLRERAMGIAATAALQFEADDLEQLRTYRDASRPEYKKVVEALNDIREQNPNVKYAYIMRPTADPYFWEFVADADSLVLSPAVDINGDGIFNDQVPPGHLWVDEEPETSEMMQGLLESVADKEASQDPWGVWISGIAPIMKDGQPFSIIGVDFNASDVTDMTWSAITPSMLALFFLAILIVFRLLAHNVLSHLDFLRNFSRMYHER